MLQEWESGKRFGNAEVHAQWLQLLLWQSQHMSSTMTVKMAMRIIEAGRGGRLRRDS
jgi:hypothetical protein